MSFYKLMRLQGKMKMRLIHFGCDEDLAHEAAAELIDIVVTSDIVREEYRAAYTKLMAEQAEEALAG